MAARHGSGPSRPAPRCHLWTVPAPPGDERAVSDIRISALAHGIAAGDRRALARAITLAESTRADHRAATQDLLAALPPGRQALRVGLSGTPGVGKSTLIEALGLHLTAQGARVAVLAVDPSSTRSGGSILGDKTRMEQLSRQPNAFIRPSPSQTALGGIARRTREAVALCEAAGFDPVLIETVGVGQSETLVAQVCDVFVLLLAPAGGDELQGVKRGIIELADLVLVNKADGDLRPLALAAAGDYRSALGLLRPRPQDPPGGPQVMTVSALTGAGLAPAWAAIRALADWRQAQGFIAQTRAAQARHWVRAEIEAEMLRLLTADAGLAARLAALEAEVAAGRLTATAAASAALAPLTGG